MAAPLNEITTPVPGRAAAATEIPDAALRARQQYIDRVPVQTILAASGYSHDRLYFWLDGAPQSDGSSLLPPIPRRRIIVRRSSRAATRVALVERLMRATEVQVHAMEQRLAAAGYEANDDDARATVVLARIMRELAALDERNCKPPNEHGQTNDVSVPLDLDELRRSLTRKLDALVAEQQGTLHRLADG
jgi:hypothetical protein